VSYRKAKTALADLQRYASPATKPIEFNLASALTNLTDAIESDFQTLRAEVSKLAQRVGDLERSGR
jgi:polyhydroxyalkanoate synthesis regulator phasin